MAKRFIDTNIFNDEWVCSLSKDAKLFFLYYITTCDHAGVLRLNKKLCEFQTGLKSIETLTQELSNSLITLKDGLFFMPRFIKFQYPNFPQSNVKQQEGAIKILKELGFWDNENNTYLTLTKELANSYVNVSDNVIKKVKTKKISFIDSDFFDKVKFKAAMPEDWSKIKLSYYYDAALRYSKEGNKYVEWDTAVISWAKKDEIQGKINFDKNPKEIKQTTEFKPAPKL
jgi:hypothetical protein